jgi:hypothetical protein
MKLIHSFEKFLSDEVDLNATRSERIEAGIGTVTKFLRSNELFSSHFLEATPQGSVRQRTTIKPSDDSDFDVDLLFQISPFESWEPKHYLEKLHDEFAKTERYKDIVDKRGKHRCVTLDYESDFHIDIVPSISSTEGDLIMNRQTNEYESTDADGYARWFQSRNDQVGNDQLVRVVKLIKYLRDRKRILMKSVLLTTMLGNQVREDDRPEAYPDLPTSLQLLLGRLDDFLQAQQTAPVIANPVLPTESFDRHWDDERFRAARTAVRKLRLSVNDAFVEADLESSLDKWRAVFGEEFSLAEADEPEEISRAVIPGFGNTSHQQPVTAIPGSGGERREPGLRVSVDGFLYSADARKRFRGINPNPKKFSDE